jgi:hypothetical protein
MSCLGHLAAGLPVSRSLIIWPGLAWPGSGLPAPWHLAERRQAAAARVRGSSVGSPLGAGTPRDSEALLWNPPPAAFPEGAFRSWLSGILIPTSTPASRRAILAAPPRQLSGLQRTQQVSTQEKETSSDSFRPLRVHPASHPKTRPLSSTAQPRRQSVVRQLGTVAEPPDQ